MAVKAARKAQGAWAKDAHARARILYAIARLMQKHSRLLAVMETLDNGKPIREARDIDVPLAIRHFLLSRGYGPIDGRRIARPRAAWRVWPDHSVEFPTSDARMEKSRPRWRWEHGRAKTPPSSQPMTAMVFCEICTQAGVPAGVVNIVTGDGETGAAPCGRRRR